MVPYSPTHVYVLARRFLCPVSCLTRAAAQRLKKAVPSILFSFVAEAISTDVIKPASRLRVARVTVQDDVQTYNYSAKIALTPPGGGSLWTTRVHEMQLIACVGGNLSWGAGRGVCTHARADP